MLNYLPLPILILDYKALTTEEKTTVTGKTDTTKTEKTVITSKLEWECKIIFRKVTKNVMELRIGGNILEINLSNPFGDLSTDTDTAIELAEKVQAILSVLWSDKGINGITLLALKKSGFLTPDFDLSPLILDKLFLQLSSEGYLFDGNGQIDSVTVDRYIARNKLGLALETKHILPASPITVNPKKEEKQLIVDPIPPVNPDTIPVGEQTLDAVVTPIPTEQKPNPVQNTNPLPTNPLGRKVKQTATV